MELSLVLFHLCDNTLLLLVVKPIFTIHARVMKVFLLPRIRIECKQIHLVNDCYIEVAVMERWYVLLWMLECTISVVDNACVFWLITTLNYRRERERFAKKGCNSTILPILPMNIKFLLMRFQQKSCGLLRPSRAAGPSKIIPKPMIPAVAITLSVGVF